MFLLRESPIGWTAPEKSANGRGPLACQRGARPARGCPTHVGKPAAQDIFLRSENSRDGRQRSAGSGWEAGRRSDGRGAAGAVRASGQLVRNEAGA